MRKRYESLAAALADSKQSRADWAKKWGVTEATVSRWVSGSRRPRGEQAITISQDTGVPLSVLIGGKAVA